MIDVPIAMRPRVFLITEWIGWLIVLVMLCSWFGMLMGALATAQILVVFSNAHDAPRVLAGWLGLLTALCTVCGMPVGMGVFTLFYCTVSWLVDGPTASADATTPNGEL